MDFKSAEEYEIANETMKEALGGIFFRNSAGTEVYVFESLFPASEGTYLSFRGKNIITGKPCQYFFNMDQFDELELVEEDSGLAEILEDL